MRLAFTIAAEGRKRPKSVHMATLIHFFDLLEGINSHHALVLLLSLHIWRSVTGCSFPNQNRVIPSLPFC